MDIMAISVIIVIIFFFSPLILSIRALRKLNKMTYLEDDVQFLKNEILKLKKTGASGGVEEKTVPLEIKPSVTVQVEEKTETPEIQNFFTTISNTEDLSDPDNPEQIVNPAPLLNKLPKENVSKWNQERGFAFLGAFLGIIGLVFLTMYLGPIIGIFFRFMIMTGFSAIFLYISFPLGKREKWEELSHISRSFSGALFLFAVFASSTIEGLKWIDSPFLSLAVISAGTVYNLFLGGFCRKKGYMVFHMSINFLVIFLLPTEPLVFWLALLLTLGLQVFGFIRKEELNSGLSFLFFAIYCLFFKEKALDLFYFSWCFNLAALVSFINFALVNDKKSSFKQVLSYVMPILWIGLAAYWGESKSEAVIPLLTGIILGSILRVRRSRDYKQLLYWPLQILAMGTLLILASGRGTQYWLGLLYLESSFFSYWKIKAGRNKSIPFLLNYLILISAVVYSFLSDTLIINGFTIANRFLLIATGSYFMMRVSEEQDGKDKDFNSLTQIFQIMLPIFAILLSYKNEGFISIGEILLYTALTLVVFFISDKNTLKIRAYGIWGTSLFPLFLIVYVLVDQVQFRLVHSILLILPILVLSMIILFFTRFRKIEITNNPGIYHLTVILVVFFYFPFRQISSILPGVLILLLSFLYYLRWDNREEKDVQIAGTVLLDLFFLRHITHNLQLEIYIGFVNVRLLIEMTSLIIFFLYLKSSRWDEKLWVLQRTLFVFTWLMLLVMIFSHSNRNILSLAFQLSAILLLYIDRKSYLKGYPLVALAYVHFIFAQLNLALNSHPSFPFLPGILQNPWIFGFINLGTSIFLIYLFFRHIKEVDFFVSPVFTRLKTITEKLFEKKNLFLLIPLFISLGLFFNWTLETTALTIALYSGCFILYGTALILRENVFRHATSAALLATSFRLVFWDLAHSTMLAKSIAFLGASIIFIVINILYSQFKGRFENV